MNKIQMFLDKLNEMYNEAHSVYERLFWHVKMGNAADQAIAAQQLLSAETRRNAFLRDPQFLKQLRDYLEYDVTGKEYVDLMGWQKMFLANEILEGEARVRADEISAIESKLSLGTQALELMLDGKVVTQADLRNICDTDPEEARREAAYMQLQRVSEFRLQNGYLTLVRVRNRLARLLGYEDYYDMQVQRRQHMSKRELFRLLDHIVDGIKPRVYDEVEATVREHGESMRKPWNFGFVRKGRMAAELDPYFPMQEVVRRWGQTFQGLGITFAGANISMDLMTRSGKFPNGFMHVPELAELVDGIPAVINISAIGTPSRVGGGYELMGTLLHEAGHAAHFANPHQRAACFLTEYPPMSAPQAEAQSMFCDSVKTDAVWRDRYALDKSGNPMPRELIIRAAVDDQRGLAARLMTLLSVAMAERAVYEMPGDALTPDNVRAVVLGIERSLLGLDGGLRPVLAMPHIVPTDSAVDYHGYVLAIMGVTQMRAYFMKKYGFLVNNNAIGPELIEKCWKPGSSITYREMMQSLTGENLSPDALIAQIIRDPASMPEIVNYELDEAAARVPPNPQPEEVVLDASLLLVHGNEHIAGFALPTMSFTAFAEKFGTWVTQRQEEG